VLRLRMREGKLERAELLMPSQGFSRWYELENRKVVASGDVEARKQAVAWALERLQAGLRPEATELAPLATYALAPIPAPAIAPTGELTDTTAEDPSEPQKQLALEPGKTPDIETLVKPKGEEPAPDMVFSPLGVTKEGRTFTTQPAANGATAIPAPAAEGGGEVMVLEGLTVPKEGGAAGGGRAAPVPTAEPVPEPEVAQTVEAVVRAFQGQGIRVVLFSAPGGSGGVDAYDGMMVERVAAPAAVKAGKPKK